MTVFSTAFLDYHHQIVQKDEEQTLLNNLGNLLAKQGLQVDKGSLAHFYVTLKSNKSLLLAGPAQSGKRTLVESVGEILTDDPLQAQFMVGHARWASQSQNVTQFVEAQEQWNKQRLMVLLEEAIRPENVDRLYIACLHQISPAELHNLFSSPGLLLFNELDPIPFPSNFRLIGTMDTNRFPWWTPELLSHTTVIQWHPRSIPYRYQSSPLDSGAGKIFLRACIKHEQIAYPRLLQIFDNQQPFQWLIQVVSLLHDYGVNVPRDAVNQAIVFLANSWTQDGRGLFASSLSENLLVAYDLTIGQYILPWIATTKHAGLPLNRQIERLFNGRFPYAAAFLETLLDDV